MLLRIGDVISYEVDGGDTKSGTVVSTDQAVIVREAQTNFYLIVRRPERVDVLGRDEQVRAAPAAVVERIHNYLARESPRAVPTGSPGDGH